MPPWDDTNSTEVLRDMEPAFKAAGLKGSRLVSGGLCVRCSRPMAEPVMRRGREVKAGAREKWRTSCLSPRLVYWSAELRNSPSEEKAGSSSGEEEEAEMPEKVVEPMSADVDTEATAGEGRELAEAEAEDEEGLEKEADRPSPGPVRRKPKSVSSSSGPEEHCNRVGEVEESEELEVLTLEVSEENSSSEEEEVEEQIGRAHV